MAGDHGPVLFLAFIGLLAVEDHAWEALNPIKLALFIIKTGVAYLLIYAVMILALAVALMLSRHLASILAYMLLLYCLILICHTLGFVTYHRQDQLGLAVAVEKPSENSRILAVHAAGLKRLLARIDRLTVANNAHAAAPLILIPVDEPEEPKFFTRICSRLCVHAVIGRLH